MGDMGESKKPQRTKQRSVRFPPEIYRWIQKLAKEKHGGDFTAAVTTLLYEAQKYQKTVERWIREGAARDADAMRLQRDRSLKEKDGSSP